METIASCAFGIDTNSIKNPDSPFLKKCRGFFEDTEKITPFAKMIGLMFCKFMSLPLKSIYGAV